MKIVSLIASATEIVCALGLEKQLVGRSHECDYPAAVRTLPVLTEPKLDCDTSSAAIDRQVKDLLREALAVYRIDGDALRRLAPDLIVTQSQCEVCAVSLKDVEAAVRDWVGPGTRIVSLQPNSLADLWDDIGRVAEAAAVPERGTELVAALRRRIDAIAARTATISHRPSVACIEWIDPLMAAGNWMPELVALAGGDNRFGMAGSHSPWMTWEDLTAADPEVILVLPCGFDIERSRREMPVLTDRAGWSELRAVRDGRVYLLDGNQYCNRPGPRLVESLEIIAEILHPDRFRFGHAGSGWESLRGTISR